MRSSLHLFALAGALIGALGCGRPPPGPPVPDDTPPDGSAHYVDGQGVARTLLTPIGTLRYGERADDELPPAGALVGYEFVGNAGDQPTLIFDVQGQTRVSLALYGARDDDGLWGRPLGHTSGLDVLRLSGVPLPADGYYFILVRALAGPPARYGLQLDCPDCGEQVCAAVDPCDLYCEQGYAAGDDACRACACEENLCGGDEDCLANEVCREGVCRPAPTCQERCSAEPIDAVCDGTGRTWGNRCVAECEGVQGELTPGRCVDVACGPDRPCPDGQRCAGGECICDCPDLLAPVCAQSGRTFSNLCNLECAGETLDYDGPCDAPPPTDCADDAGCPQGLICARGLDGPGICTLPCRPADPRGCGDRALCTVQPEGRGACLPICRSDDTCREETQCLQDRRGATLCMPCDCPAVDEPVCADGRLSYRSRCEARCAGATDDRLTPGVCRDAPAEIDCTRCPVAWQPVCADGVVRATLCDAECGDRPAMNIQPYEACFRQPPAFACRVDDDCMVTGGVGSVCAAEPTPAEPTLAPDARCMAGLGTCGCIDGLCGYRPEAREVLMCLERARGFVRPMAP